MPTTLLLAPTDFSDLPMALSCTLLTYSKVASSNMGYVTRLAGFFRLLMKGIFQTIEQVIFGSFRSLV